MNLTESNFLEILAARAIPQNSVSRGGRYYWALAGLIRMGYATLSNGVYSITPAGRDALAATARHPGGGDVRSKMRPKKI